MKYYVESKTKEMRLNAIIGEKPDSMWLQNWTGGFLLVSWEHGRAEEGVKITIGKPMPFLTSDFPHERTKTSVWTKLNANY